MNKLSFRVIEGGRRDTPHDDTAPARGVIIGVVLSAPLWLPTYCGLAWIAGWARVVVGGRP